MYRTGQRFGAGHLIDVLIGNSTERVAQYRHDQLSVFGVGAELNEKQWRTVMRQLVGLGHLQPDSEAFGALKLTCSARGVLKGESEVMLREETAASLNRKRVVKAKTASKGGATSSSASPDSSFVPDGFDKSEKRKPPERPARLAHKYGSRAGRARLRDSSMMPPWKASHPPAPKPTTNFAPWQASATRNWSAMVMHCCCLCARKPAEPTTGTHTNLKQGRSSRPRAILCTAP